MAGTSETVGEVVGPISPYDISSTGGTYIRNGAPYDVAIGGLPFVCVPNDQRPYARETAEFRTQQIDVAAQAGDQSLTGWWTRGQFTFHRGEGITYYELLSDAEAVTGRYSFGENCDPWRPGEVRLSNALTKISSTPMNKVVGTADDNVAFATGNLQGIDQDVYRVDLNINTVTAVAGLAGASYILDMCNYPKGGCLVSENGVIKSVSLDGLTITTIATLTGGGQFWRVFWAKDRIFAVDFEGRWYSFSDAAGQSITYITGAFWKGVALQLGSLTMIDAPGPAYVAIENYVYAIELDTSGVVPTVTSPRVVAVLPTKSVIQGLGWHMGYLIIQGLGGVRIAQDQGNANLTLGPNIIPGFASPTLGSTYMGATGDLVRVVGCFDGDTKVSLIELNLGEFTSPLSPSYATRRADLATVDIFRSVGWANTGFRNLLTWNTEGLWKVTETIPPNSRTVETSGYVQTGFHRFGVLDAKVFSTISVRAKGSSGTVSVSVVRKGGAVQPLATLGPDQYTEATLSIPPIGSTELVGFRFTLAASGSVTDNDPVLLGYQVKALPAPERQRMIQIPLSCFDSERIGTTDYGHEGWAWKRLEALEDLERNSGIITFQDFNTGEQRQVYIERVQFQQTMSPSIGQTRGPQFGGILVVTLRCVT